MCEQVGEWNVPTPFDLPMEKPCLFSINDYPIANIALRNLLHFKNLFDLASAEFLLVRWTILTAMVLALLED